ncbi:MAG TPA: hypothetical protein QGH10_24460 [Armatimonadota bacterium]|nr:hypothetical protein [Armatimonadota bacterium]
MRSVPALIVGTLRDAYVRAVIQSATNEEHQHWSEENGCHDGKDLADQREATHECPRAER